MNINEISVTLDEPDLVANYTHLTNTASKFPVFIKLGPDVSLFLSYPAAVALANACRLAVGIDESPAP